MIRSKVNYAMSEDDARDWVGIIGGILLALAFLLIFL